jgi:hypothetical protein
MGNIQVCHMMYCKWLGNKLWQTILRHFCGIHLEWMKKSTQLPLQHVCLELNSRDKVYSLNEIWRFYGGEDSGRFVATPCSVMVWYQYFRGPRYLHLQWIVMQCSVVVGYQRIRGPRCLHLHWDAMPCSVVVGYQRFRGPCCLHFQGEVKMEAA